MALPAIAATAGRITASAGRTAVSGTAKNAATIRSVSQMKSQFQKTQSDSPLTDSSIEQTATSASPTQQFKQALFLGHLIKELGHETRKAVCIPTVRDENTVLLQHVGIAVGL